MFAHTPRIKAQAERILQLIASDPRSTTLPRPEPLVTLSTSHFALQTPQSILEGLLEAGIRSDVASHLSKLFVKSANALKLRLEDSYRRVAASSSEDSTHLVQALYEAQFKETLDTWQRDIIVSSKRFGFQSDLSSTAKHKQSGFNAKAVPILEDAYACDAYPSREDKVTLAKETGMKYRQIHVWFQNRRSRAKREGFEPRRRLRVVSSSSEPSTVEHDSEHDAPDEDEDITQIVPHLPDDKCQVLLVGSRPIHAYPSTYPPTCDADPFPVRSGRGCFDTPWLRHAVSSSVLHSQSVDLDGLSASFSCLSLDGCKQEPQVDCADQRCAMSSHLISFSVIPPRAPLPCLVPDTSIFSHVSSMESKDLSFGASAVQMRAALSHARKHANTNFDSTKPNITKLVARDAPNIHLDSRARTRSPQLTTTSMFSSFKLPNSTDLSRLSDKFTLMAAQLPSWRVACV
ncbi:hypothetical protein C8Q75DRAFT_809573 [Abortiporus biennis]|nr:hypothetical protein C8Q75DRAFT_809573 [Abortiporus biennis]